MHTIKIIVEGGCVLDVIGLPDGFDWVVEDHDVYDAGDLWETRENIKDFEEEEGKAPWLLKNVVYNLSRGNNDMVYFSHITLS